MVNDVEPPSFSVRTADTKDKAGPSSSNMVSGVDTTPADSPVALHEQEAI